MNRITAALAALAATTLTLVGLTTSPSSAILGSAGPYNAPPSVRVYGGNWAPLVAAQNNRQGDSTPIVLSSLTPTVCTVPPNGGSAGTYQDTPRVQVTVVKDGTCRIAADQAASAYYVAGHGERAFSVTR